MKRFASVLLAVVLMLSLSLFAFADSVPPIEQSPFFVDFYHFNEKLFNSYSNMVQPYSLIPTNNNPVYATVANNEEFFKSFLYSEVDSEGYFVPQSGTGNYFLVDGNSEWFFLPFGRDASSNILPANYCWANFIFHLEDSRGNVITANNIKKAILYFMPNYTAYPYSNSWITLNSSNMYTFDDGFIQIAMASPKGSAGSSVPKICLGLQFTSTSTYTDPITFKIDTLDFYSGESSQTVPPFTFGDGAHSTTPPAPEVRDPNDAAQYGTAQDQVQWYNDAFGGAVDPELDDKIVAGNDMLLQQEEIEQDVIADFQQYSSQVDPANITFPTAVLNGMSFIGTTFMSSYNNLGDISFVISLSMMIGVVLVLIGRGEGALARGMSSSSRERRRTEYASDRDMKKGG